MGTPESLDSSGKPLKNVGKTVHLHCASQVSGNGVPGFAKNLMVIQKQWKSLWKPSFRALAPAEFQRILDFIIHQPHAIYMPMQFCIEWESLRGLRKELPWGKTCKIMTNVRDKCCWWIPRMSKGKTATTMSHLCLCPKSLILVSVLFPKLAKTQWNANWYIFPP